MRGKQTSPLPPGAFLFNATHIRLSLARFPPQDILTPFHRNCYVTVNSPVVLIFNIMSASTVFLSQNMA